MTKIKEMITKYREILVYLVVGVLTTVVSWGACFVAKFFLDSNVEMENFVINTIGWVAGVLFAYPLNRKWVFRSTNPHICKELAGFAGSRVSTWILDIVVMYVFINLWPVFKAPIERICTSINFTLFADPHYWFVKIFISSVLVTVANYLISKLFVFKKEKN